MKHQKKQKKPSKRERELITFPIPIKIENISSQITRLDNKSYQNKDSY